MLFSVIRATVPKLDLDSVFEQKNDLAKAVENELEKVKKKKSRMSEVLNEVW